MKKPYATDWKQINADIEYSKYLHLWWSNENKKYYDELGAHHNGITGMGAELKLRLLECNCRK